MARPAATLASGAVMPLLGLGTWKIPNAVAADTVKAAIGMGYRHIGEYFNCAPF